MKLQHLRRHPGSPPAGGIWYVRFHPGGYPGETWSGEEADPSVTSEGKREGMRQGIGFEIFRLRPVLAGTAGALGLAVLTTALLGA